MPATADAGASSGAVGLDAPSDNDDVTEILVVASAYARRSSLAGRTGVIGFATKRPGPSMMSVELGWTQIAARVLFKSP